MEAYQQLSRSIAGKTAIITGAASGMGRATAHLFASEGAHVAVTDLDQDKCDAVVQEIAAANYSGTAKAWALDVSKTEAIKSVVADIAATLGGIDILVNNAGFAIPADIAQDS
ncbi:MAG: SDR family NAD(P)-dependent oxidoreductase, partial [Sphingorhabdus sp.]